MATTTRKKELRKPKTEVTKQKENVETPAEIPSEKDFLNPEHLRMLEVISRDIENAKLTMALEEQALVNMTLQLEILQNKIEKQKLFVSSKAQRFELAKQKYISFKKDIWPMYGLDESKPMAYDPSSGKIQR